MNSPTIALSASSLMQAMRNRWRTGPPRASMTGLQGLENAEEWPSTAQPRSRGLMEARKGGGQHFLHKTAPKLHKVLDAAGFEPDFSYDTNADNKETTYIPKGSKPIKDEGHKFLISHSSGWEPSWEHHLDGKLVGYYDGDDESGRSSHEALVDYIKSIPTSKKLEAVNGDYDPESPEPRYVQMAKAKIVRRKDLKCRDCGFVGLPAAVDQKCPECGGVMDSPANQPENTAATTDQIRAAIRQQVLGTKQESVNTSVPGHIHDIHMTDLVTHFGYRANGDHYTVPGRPGDVIHINMNGHWVHKHHGVRHEGHGHKSLAAHLSRHARS